MRAFLLFIFLVFSFAHLYGQEKKQFQGRILDGENSVIESAIIMINSLRNEEKMLAYAISDSKGVFSAELNSDQDSVLITVSHLSYATKQFKLLLRNEPIEIVLLEKQNVLQEVVVKAERFKRIGDTLFFDVSQVKKIQDESIEDVLKRIPGIEISDDGRITYDGLPINKFYIEGMDMLEGNYSIASKRLQASLIDEIQILEKHQPIKALSSIYRPQNAAINLRLKSSSAFVHSTRGGIGYANKPVYSTDHSSFRFSKKSQASLLLNSNNSGEYTDFIFSDHFVQNVDIQDLSLTRITSPNMEVSLYRNNLETAANTTGLIKSGENHQFKFRLGGNYIREKITGTSLRRWDLGEGLVFRDSIKNQEKSNLFNPMIISEYNADKQFSKTRVELRKKNINAYGDQNINNQIIGENLGFESFDASLSNELVFSSQKKAWRIQTNLAYLGKQEELLLQPSEFIDRNSIAYIFEKTDQEIFKSGFAISSSTSVNLKVKNWTFQIPLGVEGNIKNYSSALYHIKNSAKIGLPIEFINDQRLSTLEPYLTPSTQIESGIWTLKFALPFKYTLNDFQNYNLNQQSIIQGPGLQAVGSASAFLKSGWLWNTSYKYSNEYKLLDQINLGYVLKSYQYLDRIDVLNFYRLKTNRITLSTYHKNPMRGSTFGVNTSYMRTYSPVMNSYLLDLDGVSNQLVENSNIIHYLSGNIDLKKELFNRTVLFNQKISTSIQIGTSLQDNRIQKLGAKVLSSRSSFEFSGKLWSNVISAEVDINDNTIGQPFGTYKFEDGFFIKLSDAQSIRGDYILFSSTNQENPLHYINVLFTHRFKGRLGDLSLVFTNLANAKYAVSVFRTQEYFQRSEFYLRPRQVMLKWKYNW